MDFAVLDVAAQRRVEAVGVAAAPSGGTAASVEEHHGPAVFAADVGEALLGAVDGPVGAKVPAVLGAVGEAEHDGLVSLSLVKMSRIHRVRVELGHLGAGAVQILNRLKQRHQIHRQRPLPSAGLGHGMQDCDVIRSRAVAQNVSVTPSFAVVQLDLLHRAEAVQYILMALLVELPLKDAVVAEQEIQSFRFRKCLEFRHGPFPIHGSQERIERLGHDTGVLTDVERCEMHSKHPHLEHELADLVQIQSVELGLHTLFKSMQAMEKDVLLEREVARIEDGLLNHALKHVQLALQSFEGDEAAELPEFLFVAAQQREFQFARHPECGVSAHIGVAISVSARPKPNPQHAVVQALAVGTTQGIGHTRAERRTRLKEHVLEVPNLPDGLLVRGGRLALKERRQAQLMKALADVHQVVVLHGQGQVGDDRQHVAWVKLRWM